MNSTVTEKKRNTGSSRFCRNIFFFDSIDIAVAIFLDLQKAFYTSDQILLFKKLEKYGIRGIPQNWLISYLEDRYQYVSVNNTSS